MVGTPLASGPSGVRQGIGSAVNTLYVSVAGRAGSGFYLYRFMPLSISSSRFSKSASILEASSFFLSSWM